MQAKRDGDTLNVQAALHMAKDNPATDLGEDSDLFLPCHVRGNTSLDTNSLTFRSDKLTDTKRRVWPILWFVDKLGKASCRHLPAIHAITCCDTTSIIFGIGKGFLFKGLSDRVFKKNLDIFFLARMLSFKMMWSKLMK